LVFEGNWWHGDADIGGEQGDQRVDIAGLVRAACPSCTWIYFRYALMQKIRLDQSSTDSPGAPVGSGRGAANTAEDLYYEPETMVRWSLKRVDRRGAAVARSHSEYEWFLWTEVVAGRVARIVWAHGPRLAIV
jgi:hypothetical protein